MTSKTGVTPTLQLSCQGKIRDSHFALRAVAVPSALKEVHADDRCCHRATGYQREYSPRRFLVRRRRRPEIHGGLRGVGCHRNDRRGADRAPAGQSDLQPRHRVDKLRPPPPAAHQRGDLRLRRQRVLLRLLLLHAAPAQGAHVQRHAEQDPLLGLAGDHSRRRPHPAARLHAGEGIRRAGMADRHRHRSDLGGVRGELHRHADQAPRTSPVRRPLVLPRVDHHRRDSAHLQQPLAARWRVQELQHLRRRAGCVHAVVVRPQRRRVLPDDAVPGSHVLLHAEGGGRAGVQLPALDPAFLVAGVHVHLGRSAPSALHRTPGMGGIAGHGLQRDVVGAELGRHDQRPADAAWRLAQGGERSDPQVLRDRHHRVRHVDVRRPDAQHQERERAGALQ